MNRKDLAEEYDEDLVFMDNFDDAILGVYWTGCLHVVAYDECTIIDILMEDMPMEEAMDYFEYNIASSYVGERTPLIIEGGHHGTSERETRC